MSDGFIGEASTRISTSPVAGSGFGTVSTENTLADWRTTAFIYLTSFSDDVISLEKELVVGVRKGWEMVGESEFAALDD